MGIRKTAAFLLLAAIPMVAVVLAAALHQWVTGEDLRIAGQLEDFDRMRAIAAFDPAKLKDQPAEDAFDSKLLGHDAAPVLSAKLQAMLRDLAAKRNVIIGQASELASDDLGNGLQRAGTHLEFSGQQQAMLEFLADVDRQSPWLFLGNVDIRSSEIPGATMDQESPIAASADFWGVIAVTAADKPKAPVQGVTQP